MVLSHAAPLVSFPYDSTPPPPPPLLLLKPPFFTRRRIRIVSSSSLSPSPRSSPHNNKKKKKRPLRPSFEEQTLRRWSARLPSQRPSFPWQQPRQQQQQDDAYDDGQEEEPETPTPISHLPPQEPYNMGESNITQPPSITTSTSTLNSIVEHFNYSSDNDDDDDDDDRLGLSGLSDGVGQQWPLKGAGLAIGYRSVSAPWMHGAESPNNYLDSWDGAEAAMEKNDVNDELVQEELQDGSSVEELHEHSQGTNKSISSTADHPLASVEVEEELSKSAVTKSSSFAVHPRDDVMNSVVDQLDSEADAPSRRLRGSGFDRRNRGQSRVSTIVDTLRNSMQEDSPNLHHDVPSFRKSNDQPDPDDLVKMLGPVLLPWEREEASDGNESGKGSNTELAERTIPEPELRRLRDAALRMKERVKIGPGGVTQAVVEIIHGKWKEDEVVKMRFEGPPSLNMKRTHEILEAKTGGIVIWRSGRSLVLYRGMNYKLRCVQSYAKIAVDDSNKEVSDASSIPASSVVSGHMQHSLQTSRSDGVNSSTSVASSSQEATNTFDIDSLLDQLGPRYKDWSGHGPLPVDADLLPGVVPGYRPPFRLLPYKTKGTLRNREMTSLRRLARQTAPHFALGRNRQHQGLATAIVKLWEKSAIAKIAIKRGIPNTCNDRMAEEIKKLTGGVLLSRNKEYIIFYRGNDFITPRVREVLVEKQQQAITQQDEEELARLRASASITAIPDASKSPLVAGTLTESREAKSRWGDALNSEERKKEKMSIALAKHASLVKNLERKLVLAKGKVAKAEKALAKVQEFLVPAELPTDLETVTDEERFLFRRIGLKMRAFLLLGRREVFDGTVQNMHFHWKHRELVKIVVKGKNFAQVKHIAISLEAESGGVLISLDKTTKGYAIIFYRGKNYKRPKILKPKNLLTRRRALARSIELQRREALNHHISSLQETIQNLKSQLEQMKAGKEKQDEDLLLRVDDLSSDDDNFEDEGEEAYLQTYSSGDEEDPNGSSNEYF